MNLDYMKKGRRANIANIAYVDKINDHLLIELYYVGYISQNHMDYYTRAFLNGLLDKIKLTPKQKRVVMKIYNNDSKLGARIIFMLYGQS